MASREFGSERVFILSSGAKLATRDSERSILTWVGLFFIFYFFITLSSAVGSFYFRAPAVGVFCFRLFCSLLQVGKLERVQP